MSKSQKYSLCSFGLAMLLCNYLAIAEETRPSPDIKNMSLTEVIANVIKKNPQIKETITKWNVKQKEINAAWGDFEPQFIGKYHRDKLDREASISEIQLQSGRRQYGEENEQYNFGIEGKVISGGNYWVGNTSSRQFTSVYKKILYDSFLGISYQQPLLKGAWMSSPLASIQIAQKEESIAYQIYRQQLMETISQTESIYWELAYAQEKYKITQESTNIARNLVEDSTQRVLTGKMSELDLMEAQAGLELRLSQQAESYQELMDTMHRLKLLFSDNTISENIQIVAKDPIITPDTLNEDVNKMREESLSLAMKMQPDLLSRKHELEKDKIVVGYRTDQRLPELNIKTSYGLRGHGENLDQSLRQIQDKTYPGWTVDVEMKLPLFSGIKEQNDLDAAYLKKNLSEERIKATEYELTQTIENITLKISSLQKRIKSTKIIVDFQKKLLEVEIARMQEGKSNIRKVYEIEKERDEANRKALETIVRYREAIMQLVYIRGSLLIDKGLASE
ncbi:MAG TPA: hypothetical protein DCS13_07425 [Candidatus Margulisbacteria bacterium]|nr:MAG: hypothetical protein A2X43_08885 [Candidatus Margulisbacteria bacterium GWD2_39_127]OGI01459.1 MAG: hypothetical protein A2X42_09840 [Candidatus Margulisbacteria bacterium GWF2_38_17]HAR63278.1 hypothetical protein [Candidatus Margulisiibacteriota bacterium]